MNHQIFTSDSRTTINWASGTSTELFIYPSGGNFADRNFIFRISTATVEAKESTFTFFEGITRHLMILKGELELIHEGRYTKHLKPFDQDIFSGEWPTRSKGKVTDFNLMLKDGATGSLTHHRLEPKNAMVFTSKTAYEFLYLVSGTATLDNGITVKARDLIRVDQGTEAAVRTQERCDLVEIKVSLLKDLAD
jgi:uncharacterized protein